MKTERHVEIFEIKGEDLAKISYNDFMQDIARLSAFCDVLAEVNHHFNSPVYSKFIELSQDLIKIAQAFNQAYFESLECLEPNNRPVS